MAGKTVEDLKTLRAALVERRLKEAYWAAEAGAFNDTRIARLVQADRAIAALDVVIAEGRAEPEEETQDSDSRAGFL